MMININRASRSITRLKVIHLNTCCCVYTVRFVGVLSSRFSHCLPACNASLFVSESVWCGNMEWQLFFSFLPARRQLSLHKIHSSCFVTRSMIYGRYCFFCIRGCLQWTACGIICLCRRRRLTQAETSPPKLRIFHFACLQSFWGSVNCSRFVCVADAKSLLFQDHTQRTERRDGRAISSTRWWCFGSQAINQFTGTLLCFFFNKRFTYNLLNYILGLDIYTSIEEHRIFLNLK